MGAKDRRPRSVGDMSRLSAQTRQKAWTVFMDLTRNGMDEETAIRNALQEACPAKDDPYYPRYYPNKKRELNLWLKKGLWPLSKPKDEEYNTAGYDSVEVCTGVLDELLRERAQALDHACRDSPSTDQELIDTLEFDPSDVARIIQSYKEHRIASDSVSADHSSEYEQREESARGTCLSQRNPPMGVAGAETDSERIARGFFGGMSGEDALISASSPENYSQPDSQPMASVVEPGRSIVQELMEMLTWWRQCGAHLRGSVEKASARPDFMHDKMVTKQITVHAELCKDAEAKAKEGQHLTRRTLSGLVEFLLWQYLGSSDKYLKR